MNTWQIILGCAFLLSAVIAALWCIGRSDIDQDMPYRHDTHNETEQ